MINSYIRHPIGVLIAVSIFLTFSIAMVIPVEYIPVDTRYDKIQHACVFLILTCSISACLRINHWFIGIFLAILAIASECIQDLIPYRSGSWEDLYADIIGISVACLIIEIAIRIYQAWRSGV
ncbi:MULTISPECIES: VanZ family protein [Alteromonadaceae]|uniref:VanZ family protein n=1 Tax=Alteromonadaceae TaxID=72275 RepID=UPI001C08F576|nr:MULTISPECIES: VanZ family protein [Aliiglaciecola]MBU2879942.1 VanZ family protein [Aliiglaciecola lipolytica]MDO6712372.1 VanZ family protein [Aliiglaciecola sp. 2_MG-2023]MDO6753366.1 VanZ family protein [Aliiglaciecola sp. 1_MG-2023]